MHGGDHRMSAVSLPFADRAAAGRALAQALSRWRNTPDVLVLALPRGGVPVGAEVARALHAALDLLIVRKLGAPSNPELAIGAIASGGVRVLNTEIVAGLGVSDTFIAQATARERQELARRDVAYRGERPPPTLAGRTLILVDDGIATGATMRAGIAALRTAHPARLIVAVPVAPPDTAAVLRAEADEVHCLVTPEPFGAVGRFYADFTQVEDADVRRLLAAAWTNDPR